jgi:hypothetical protein
MQSNPPSHRRDEARAFWTGPQLSRYEELSLLSFVATGARVLLYSNDMTLRVPEGVELVDVNELLPRQTQSFSYEDGDQCLTPHSDLFRYVAVERFGGWYFDLDVICMRKELPREKVYLAREAPHLVNAAVMKLPAQAPVLTAAIAEARRLWPEAGRMTIGPELMTRLIGEYSLDHLIRPRACAYEIGYDEILSLFDPDAKDELDERVADSDFVHLWNEIWRRIRIPKNYGPPEGSFVDGLFRRFDINFASDARLSHDAIETWIRERQILSHVAAQGIASFEAPPPATMPPKKWQKAADPQTVRTLCQGKSIGHYQLLCLRSFVDRGHRVEVFSFNPELELPRWLKLKNAADIVDPERVLRYLAEHERFAVHADLFRYSLLHKLGGWWINPDVVLLSTELPTDDLFVSRLDKSGGLSTAAMKFPAQHPLLTDVLDRIATFEQPVTDWDPADNRALVGAFESQPAIVAKTNATDPVSWFDVLDLFDPAQAVEVAERCAGKAFLELHMDVWLRAGVPGLLGPPQGSFLDRLFHQHKVGFHFPEQMQFGDARRWIIHFYECLRLRDGLTKNVTVK